MTDKDVRHLTRTEFLVILRDQEEEIDRLNKENEGLRSEITRLNEELRSKQTNINRFGSIAEASIGLNDVFIKAQAAADQYVNEVKEKTSDADVQSAKIIEDANRQAAEIIARAKEEAARRQGVSQNAASDSVSEGEIEEALPMKIEEILPETDIIVTVRTGDKHIDFLTRSIDRQDPDVAGLLPIVSRKYNGASVLPVELICSEDNRPLSFMVEGLTYTAVGVIDEKPYKWLNVIIPCIKTKSGRQIHVVVASAQGNVTNRRDDYRLYIGVDGMLSMAAKQNTEIDAIIKDVSVGGIGIVVMKPSEIAIGSTIRAKFEARFNNSKMARRNGGTMHFDLIGKVVRRKDIDEERVIYGIQLLSHSSMLTRYINMRQSEQIENERSDRAIKKGLLGVMKSYDEENNI